LNPIAEEFPKIFRLEIPLPGNPLKAINSYVIQGAERFLMIDTGMNRPECLEAMQRHLQELKVDLQATDFFITHLHADHLGLVSELTGNSSRIYFNHPDAAFIQNENRWEEMMVQAGMNGFPEEELGDAIQKHPGRKYHARGSLRFTLLGEGDRIRIGEYVFQCVETPGHTPGHMCLYEPNAKIFFSGDHLLGSITPNISSWADDDDSLEKYLKSLDKIRGYEISWVLPGHRRPFAQPRQRIADLEHHHAVRNAEILTILQEGAKNAYQVAGEMIWDIDCETWEDFPIPQKWFAAGEALAHLQFLRANGRVKRELHNGKAFFCLA